MFVPSFHFSSLIWVHVMMNAGWGGKALMSSAPPGRSRGYPWPVGMHNPSNVFRVPSQLDLPRSTSAGRQPGGSDDPDIWVFSTWKSRGLEATHCVPLKADSRQSLFWLLGRSDFIVNCHRKLNYTWTKAVSFYLTRSANSLFVHDCSIYSVDSTTFPPLPHR